jgi:hypothetical protein
MASRKSILGLGLFVTLAYAGHQWLERNVEVVTLHTQATAASFDHFARVLIVDDPPSAWIRAEKPDRLWLGALRENPEVLIHRDGRDQRYEAEIWDGGAHERVDRLFREKYGLLDRVLGWLWRRDPVMIRLDPE